MNKQNNRYAIKVPQSTKAIYCEKKKVLTIEGPLKKKSLELKFKIYLNKPKNVISVSPRTLSRLSYKNKKKIKALRNTEIAQIKHLIVESSTTIFKKFKIVGVGYRVDSNDAQVDSRLVTLKLGFSHPVYVRIPEHLSMSCLTKSKFYVFGNSYEEVCGFSAKVRAKKVPDTYKGKGILYENETPVLKEGKKV